MQRCILREPAWSGSFAEYLYNRYDLEDLIDMSWRYLSQDEVNDAHVMYGPVPDDWAMEVERAIAAKEEEAQEAQEE